MGVLSWPERLGDPQINQEGSKGMVELIMAAAEDERWTMAAANCSSY